MKKALWGMALLMSASAGSAMAADMGVPVEKAPSYVPGYSWSGFYIGANAGYSFGRAANTLADSTTTVDTTGVTLGVVTAGAAGTTNMSGWIAGGQIGFNWQIDSFVTGLEADMQATGQRGSLALCDTAGCPAGAISTTQDYKLPWLATFRARLGMTLDPRWLVYATGGLAVGEVDANDTAAVVTAPPGITPFGSTTNNTRFGWTAGAGFEAAFDEHWSFKVEYLYVDLGTVGQNMTGVTNAVAPFSFFGFTIPGSVSTTAVAVNTHITDNIVRAGVNFKF